MEPKHILRLIRLAFALMALCALPGCGSGGDVPNHSSPASGDNSLVWNRGEWGYENNFETQGVLQAVIDYQASQQQQSAQRGPGT